MTVQDSWRHVLHTVLTMCCSMTRLLHGMDLTSALQNWGQPLATSVCVVGASHIQAICVTVWNNNFLPSTLGWRNEDGKKNHKTIPSGCQRRKGGERKPAEEIIIVVLNPATELSCLFFTEHKRYVCRSNVALWTGGNNAKNKGTNHSALCRIQTELSNWLWFAYEVTYIAPAKHQLALKFEKLWCQKAEENFS